jgi:hypothetical protein
MACHPTEFFSLTGQVAAADFSAPPNLALVSGADAFQDFQQAYEILGITLTSSLTNFGTAVMGIFVCVGPNTPTITYSKTTPAPVGAVTGTNSLVGPPAVPIPSDKTIVKVFLQPKRIGAGTRIALYAFGDTTAGNFAYAAVSLDMRRVD